MSFNTQKKTNYDIQDIVIPGWQTCSKDFISDICATGTNVAISFWSGKLILIDTSKSDRANVVFKFPSPLEIAYEGSKSGELNVHDLKGDPSMPIMRICFNTSDNDLPIFIGDPFGFIYKMHNEDIMKKIISSNSTTSTLKMSTTSRAAELKLTPYMQLGGPIVGLEWCSKEACLCALSADGRLAVVRHNSTLILQLSDCETNLPVALSVAGSMVMIATKHNVFFEQISQLKEGKNLEPKFSHRIPISSIHAKTDNGYEYYIYLGDVENNLLAGITKSDAMAFTMSVKIKSPIHSITSVISKGIKSVFIGSSDGLIYRYKQSDEKLEKDVNDLSLNVDNKSSIIKFVPTVASGNVIYVASSYDWSFGGYVARYERSPTCALGVICEKN